MFFCMIVMIELNVCSVITNIIAQTIKEFLQTFFVKMISFKQSSFNNYMSRVSFKMSFFFSFF